MAKVTERSRSGTARRTQEERSAATRAQLLDATIECLLELGYSATTTTVIAERAGVSRGAQLHHYPTKADLVAAAVEHLASKLAADAAAELARVPVDADWTSAAVDLLWSAYTKPLFPAWLELSVAARTDADLRAVLAPVEARLRHAIEQGTTALIGEWATTGLIQQVLTMTVYLFHGMALARTLSVGADEELRYQENAVLPMWREIAKSVVSVGAAATGAARCARPATA